MAGDNPALIVRVVANLEELKTGLQEGQQAIRKTTAEMEESATAADKWSKSQFNVTESVASTGAAADVATGRFASLRGGLNEVAEGAGLTAGELGLFATAGLLAGAAMAGWKVGRAVMEFFELDEAVSKSWVSLLGWGDAAKQAAGANAEALAKASALAGREITTMKEALEINGAAVTEWSNTLRRANAPEESAKQIREWHADLQKVVSAGVLPSLVKDIDSHNFSLKALAERYGVSVEALQLFVRETKAAGDEERATNDAIHDSNQQMLADTQAQINALKPFRAAMEELNSVGVGWKGTLDTIDGAVVEGIEFYLKAGVSQKALAEAYGLTDAQVKSVARALRDEADATKQASAETDRMAKAAEDAAAALDREAEAHAKVKKEAEAAAAAVEKLKAANRAMGNSTEYDLSTDAGRAKVPEGIATWLHDGYSLAQAAQIDFLMRWGLPINANDPLFKTKGPRVPGFEFGSEGFQDFGAGTLAMLHGREAVVSEKASGSGGLGGDSDSSARIIQLVVDGRVLAQVVDDALTRRLRNTGYRIPTGI